MVYILESRLIASGSPSPWVIDCVGSDPVIAAKAASAGRENDAPVLVFVPVQETSGLLKLVASDGIEEWRIREFEIEYE